MSYPIVRRKELNIPHFDPDLCDFLENFGKMTVYDDRHDLYQLSSRRHPSNLHHWIGGSFMVVLGQMGNMMSKIGMYMQTFSEQNQGEQDLGIILRQFIQGMSETLPQQMEESYGNMKMGVKEERAIPLEELKNEYGYYAPIRNADKPLLSAPSVPDLKKY